MYLVELWSKKGIFVSNTELGLLPGSLSDWISFRKEACCARMVQTIPITFGNLEHHHNELGKTGVTAGHQEFLLALFFSPAIRSTSANPQSLCGCPLHGQ